MITPMIPLRIRCRQLQRRCRSNRSGVGASIRAPGYKQEGLSLGVAFLSAYLGGDKHYALATVSPWSGPSLEGNRVATNLKPLAPAQGS
jgi:hypothetical protein